MEIVIDIPETLKKIADEKDIKTFSHYMWSIIVMDAIKNGTLLPEQHGRLIDADALYENTEICHSDIDGYACVRWKDINDAPTIIEGSESDGKI
jgi:hypothetical protein